MTALKGAPSASVRAVVERVVEKALARGASPPSWVAVDDGNGAWLDEVASAPPAERARGVVAAGGEETLRRSIRLGVGGAVWMPPSTLAMTEACAAAARSELPPVVDPSLVDLVVDRGGPLVLVTVDDLVRWHADLGEAEVARLLTSLARCLGVPPALVSSALLTPQPAAGAVGSAWEGVVAEAEWAADLAPVVIPVPDGALGRLFFPTVAEALARRAPPETRPIGATARACQVEHGVTTPLGDPTSRGEPSVRVPAWASRRPRPGTPAGLLLERMAAACERDDAALWVPLVDRSSLPFLLRLPGRLWLDGPVVETLSGRRA
jgi:hypothetical protein